MSLLSTEAKSQRKLEAQAPGSKHWPAVGAWQRLLWGHTLRGGPERLER